LKAVLLRWFVQGIQKIYPHIDDYHCCHYCYCIIYFSVAASFIMEEKLFYSIAPSLSCCKWSEEGWLACISEPIVIKYEGI